MINANVELWLQALESGEWKQAIGSLETPDGLCCLGVACRLYEQEGGTLQIDSTHPQHTTFNGKSDYLPKVVMRWLGLSENNGTYFLAGAAKCLSRDNDNGLSFTDIATIIRSEPIGLFDELG